MHKYKYTSRIALKGIFICFTCLFCIVIFSSCKPPGRLPSVTLADLKKTGTLFVLTDASFPPYEYYDTDHNIAGVDIDIARYIAKKLNLELQVQDMNFQAILMELEVSDKGNLALAGISMTEERKKKYPLYSIPYADVSQKIVINKEKHPNWKNFKDIINSQVGVQLGTTSDSYMTKQIEKKLFKEKDLHRYNLFTVAIKELENETLDAIVADSKTAELICSKYNFTTLSSESSDIDKEYYVILYNNRTSREVVNTINKFIKEIKENGTLDSYYKNHMKSILET